jgi:hypothetical protein
MVWVGTALPLTPQNKYKSTNIKWIEEGLHKVKIWSDSNVFLTIVLIFCVILTHFPCKIFLDLRYEELVSQMNLK